MQRWWNLNTLEETLSTGAVVLMLAGITFDTTFVKNSPNVRVIIALVMASLLIIMIVFYIMSFVQLAVSFTDKTEKFLREDGYTKLDPDLGDLRMPPDARIWCKYGGREREKTAKAQDEKYYLWQKQKLN